MNFCEELAGYCEIFIN